MKKLNFKKFVIVAVFGVTILGCSDNEVEFPSMSVTEPIAGEVEANYSTKDNLSDVNKNSPLFFRLGMIPETEVLDLDAQTDYLSSRSPIPTPSCEISPGSARGTAVNCTVQVPELSLNYSHLKFIVGSNAPAQCPFLMFDPYLFRRSVAELDPEDIAKPGYMDPSNSESVNCAFGPDLVVHESCYGGAGPQILKLYNYDVTKTRGMYFRPSTDKNLRYYYLPSSNKIRANGSFPTNIYSANYSMPTSGPVAYSDVRSNIVFNTLENMEVYKFTCQNAYRETIYTLNLTIQSVPRETPADGLHFWNWEDP